MSIDLSLLRGRRVLVTGASGFIGGWVTGCLVAHGASVTAMVSGRSGRSHHGDAVLRAWPDAVTVVTAELTDPSSLRAMVERCRPELVIHQAAFTHVGRSFSQLDANIQTNIQGTVNLLTVLDGGYRRFVYVGSGDVYGDGPVPFVEDGPISPASPYAVSKYAAERFCRMFQQAYGWPIVCLRPFNVYGPGQSPDRIIPELIASGLRGEPLKMTEGRQTREFTYVGDVAQAFCRALVAPGVEGRVINIGRGEEVAIRDLALLVVELLGAAPPLFGALAYRPTEIWRMFGDSRLAGELLDWHPATRLEDGLRHTIDWARAQLLDS